jgi:hypothetical protein
VRRAVVLPVARAGAALRRDCGATSSRSVVPFAAISGDHLRRDQQLGAPQSCVVVPSPAALQVCKVLPSHATNSLAVQAPGSGTSAGCGNPQAVARKNVAAMGAWCAYLPSMEKRVVLSFIGQSEASPRGVRFSQQSTARRGRRHVCHAASSSMPSIFDRRCRKLQAELAGCRRYRRLASAWTVSLYVIGQDEPLGSAVWDELTGRARNRQEPSSCRR